MIHNEEEYNLITETRERKDMERNRTALIIQG